MLKFPIDINREVGTLELGSERTNKTTGKPSYIIKVSKAGYKDAEVKVSADKSWYRTDAEKPIKTIKITLVKE
ncbi:MAG: hypothetical protein L6455_02130 [Kiritimatiellae bacterium]|nr:hypothetical protein [Kiritimatiellia bacterium]